MAKTIWKFPLEITDEQSIDMPRGAQLLNVAIQGAHCCLWAMVDPSKIREGRKVNIYGTGHALPDDPGRYIGTFMISGDVLVFHAFDPNR